MAFSFANAASRTVTSKLSPYVNSVARWSVQASKKNVQNYLMSQNIMSAVPLSAMSPKRWYSTSNQRRANRNRVTTKEEEEAELRQQQEQQQQYAYEQPQQMNQPYQTVCTL